jgi:hypothetical protein
MYSQTCIKRSPLGQRKGVLIRPVTSVLLIEKLIQVKPVLRGHLWNKEKMWANG